MRVLLDENVPVRLKFRLDPPHETSTVQENGWTSYENGALLSLAAESFDVFVTFDANLQYQQNLTGQGISVLIIRAPSNAYRHIAPLLPTILSAIEDIRPGEVRTVSG